MGERPKVERWVILRLQGVEHRKACRMAGYASEAAPPEARRLLSAARQVVEMPESAEWIPEQLDEAERKASELRVLARACELVEVYNALIL